MTGSATQLIKLIKEGKRLEANALGDEILKDANGRRDELQRNLIANILDYYGGAYLKPRRCQLALLNGRLIDECNTEIQQGISLVTCCMNRETNLLKALATWLRVPQVDEIVIVDWSSAKPVRETIIGAGLDSNKITYLRIEGQARWILSYAFNAGFRIARFSRIIKCDADIELSTSFCVDNAIEVGEFRSGNWRTAEKGQEHINGFFYIHREDLLAVKAFNEHITTYGWDDDDLYGRLLAYGCKRLAVATGSIWHIPHGDELRLPCEHLPHQTSSLREVLAKDPAHKIRTNKFLTEIMPEWNVDRRFIEIRIDDFSERAIIARQTAESWHIVPAHIVDFCEYASVSKWLSWRFGGNVFWLNQEKMRLLIDSVSDSSLSKVVIDLLLRSNGPELFEARTIVLVDIDGEVSDQDETGGYLTLSELAGALGRHLFIHRPYPRESSALWNLPLLLFIGDGLELQGIATVSIEDACNAVREEANGPRVDRKVVATCVSESSLKDLCQRALAHKRQLPRRNQSRKNLYIDAQHGLGNRLRAIASAAAIAQATHRELHIVWRPDCHCEATFFDLFESDLKVSDSWKKALPKSAIFYNYMEIEEGSCKDKAIVTDTDADICIKSAYTLNHPDSNWNAQNAFLAHLVPTKRVRELVQSVPHDYVAAMHIRSEGAPGNDSKPYDATSNWTAEGHAQINYWRSKSNPQAFFPIADKLLEQEPNRGVFLATDTETVYEMFVTRYGTERLRYLKRHVFDRSSEQAIYALADALLLSHATKIYGSNWSSFTELAMRFGNGHASLQLAGVDFSDIQE